MTVEQPPMDPAPSIDQLENRKRSIQNRMEEHRAEIAGHLIELSSPFRLMSSGVRHAMASPWARLALAGAVGFALIMIARRRQPKRGSGWLKSFVVSRLRTLAIGWGTRLVFQYVRRRMIRNLV